MPSLTATLVGLIVTIVTILFLRTVEIDAGFLEGAPCSIRNTAYLDTTAIWRLPPVEPVQCVDISSVGNTTIFPVVRRIRNATILYADHMNLDTFPKFITFKLQNLILIDLSGNKIRKLNSKSLRFVKNIGTLLLADNRVYIPRRRPLLISPTLDTLSLSNNHIKRLTKYTFTQIPKLRVLYLDRNVLKHLRPEVFTHLQFLKYLHVGNNQLVKVPPKELMPQSLRFFITKGNPLEKLLEKGIK